jgi:hypothetical protein
MDQHAVELSKILENELVLHTRLLAAAHSMNIALKKEAIDDVRLANMEYDECTCHIEAIEEKRLSLSDAIAAQLGCLPHANLLRIIESLPASDRGNLLDLRAQLRSALAEIQKTNAANKILLTESLFAIGKTFEFIAMASEKFHGYKQQGRKHASKISRTIINTIA